MNLAFSLIALLFTPAMQDRPSDAKAKSVASITGENVAIIVHVDLKKWDTERFLRATLGKMADDPEIAQDVLARAKNIDSWAESLKKAGANDFYVLFEPDDFPGLPIVAVSMSEGASGQAIAKILSTANPQFPVQWPTTVTIGGFVIAGTPDSVARLKNSKVVARPEVIEALTARVDVPIQIALVPSQTMRRVIEESMPNLPPQIGGGPVTKLSKGLRWASFVLATEPKISLRAVLQAQDAAAAKDLEKLAIEGFSFLTKATEGDVSLTEMVKEITKSKPLVQGDRVTFETDPEKATSLVAVPIAKAREAARRTQCVNNLKQMGLAMHNYLSSKETFPAAYSVSKDDKPLLSWRVHILPYLEQQALYNEFHLDEPWDSEHNKTLISKMPMTFVCPSANKALVLEGKTCYLTPRGPKTMFPGSKGVKIQDITDGTSNTIMVVEANDQQAVIWTKPDDWDIANTAKPQTLVGHHPGGTNIGFADGSVKFLKETVSAKVLRDLVTTNGGEVINADDF